MKGLSSRRPPSRACLVAASIVAAACALATAPRVASAAPLSDAALAPIRAALAAVDAGDAAGFADAFAPNATILDEISPFSFAGPDAPRMWLARLANVNRDNAIADERSTVGAPRAGSVEANAAYAVVPVRIAYRQHGRAVVESGAWTFALRNAGGRWKIALAAFAPATP